VYVRVGLPGLRVPLAGDGALGVIGAEGFAICVDDLGSWVEGFAVNLEDFGVRLLKVTREPVEDDAAKLSIASETAEAQIRTQTKLRVLVKPNLEEDFLFM